MDDQEVEQRFFSLVAEDESSTRIKARMRAASLYMESFTVSLLNQKAEQLDLFEAITNSHKIDISVEDVKDLEDKVDEQPRVLERVSVFDDIELAKLRVSMAREATQAVYGLTRFQSWRAEKMSVRNLKYRKSV